ncbi:MAG: LPXTG cell wall anchor domain-containing protein [Bacilli bacterium]|nr:LPXTG cell wall anchor domain-containing protein [Bacilli bacterium]MBR6949639.1 LPXTG cell wall anchor domain-containing protein [Bacilli bacterium]
MDILLIIKNKYNTGEKGDAMLIILGLLLGFILLFIYCSLVVAHNSDE